MRTQFSETEEMLQSALRKEALDSIRAVHAGADAFQLEMRWQEHNSSDALTTRGIEVLRLIVAGNPNKELSPNCTLRKPVQLTSLAVEESPLPKRT